MILTMLQPVYAESEATPLTIAAEYDDVGDFQGGFAAVEIGGDWGAIDKTGKLIVEPRFDWIEDFIDGYALAGKYTKSIAPDGKSASYVNLRGLIEKKSGEVILEPIYNEVQWRGDGVLAVAKDEKYGLFDLAGNSLGEARFQSIGEFKEGLAQVSVPHGSDDYRFGFIDLTGKLVIPTVYEGVFAKFESGLAIVGKSGKWGVIDKKGKIVIPFQYDKMSSSFVSGYAAVAKKGKWGVVDTKGKLVIPLKYDEVEVGPQAIIEYGIMRKPIVKGSLQKRQIVDRNGNYHDADWGAIDLRTRKAIVPPQYQNVEVQADGLIIVKKADKYGIVDRTGKPVVPAKYVRISDYHDPARKRIYVVRTKDQLGIYNPATKQGVIRLYGYESAEFYDYKAELESMYPDVVRVHTTSNKWGLLDLTGKEIVKPAYDDIADFSEGLAAVKLNGKYGFIDAKGKLVIKPQYESVGTFREGLVSVKKSGKYGFVDKRGAEIVPPQFDRVHEFSDGLAAVNEKGKWGFISNPLTK
ncbi:WG repeat-containing protein [Cohnella sp. GCM10027633]|uniref:WG repeat-containing protein n=1 Tax=unclassified Cohnella TaxID=2636738 RepID=UPI00362994E6